MAAGRYWDRSRRAWVGVPNLVGSSDIPNIPPALAFYNDRFTVDEDMQTSFVLTYLPVQNSEHVYSNGRYLQEGSAWNRSEKTVEMEFAVEIGDSIVVEYAYYVGG